MKIPVLALWTSLQLIRRKELESKTLQHPILIARFEANCELQDLRCWNNFTPEHATFLTHTNSTQAMVKAAAGAISF